MAITGWITFAITAQIVASIGKYCPSSEWTYHKGKCYLVPDGPFLSWFGGRAMCKSLGGDLVLPKSQEENDFVQLTLRVIHDGQSVGSGWIRCYIEEDWRACSEDPDQYTNFDSTLTDTGKCTVLRKNKGMWRGLGCEEARRIICEARPSKYAESLICFAIPHDQPRCLTNHIIAQFRLKSYLQCCTACYLDPGCHSFNLKGGICQHNNVTASEVDSNFSVMIENCAYYEYIGLIFQNTIVLA